MKIFIEVANLVMLRVLPNSAVLRDTRHSEKIGVRHVYPFLMQMLLASLFNHFEKSKKLSNKITEIERKSLVMFIEQAFGILKQNGKFILEHLDDEVIRDSLFSLVQARELTFETLTNAIQKIAIERYQKMGVKLEFILECETIVNAVSHLFMNNEVFMEMFHTHVWNVFFRGDLQSANRRARNFELLQKPCHTMTRSSAAIVAQNAVTFPLGTPPFVPAKTTRLLNAPVHSVHEQSVPAQVLESLPVQPVNDTNVLVSAVFNKLFEEAFDNFIAKSAEAIGAENQAALSRILGEESDANVLRDEVARQAIIAESDAFMSTSESLEVAVLVNEVAEADESLFQETHNLNSLARSVDPDDIQLSSPVEIINVPVSPTDYFPPASSKIPSLKNVTPGDANSAALFAAIHSPIQLLPGQPQFDPQNHANEVGGPLSVIPEEEEDGADQSGKSSPLPPNGEGRAHFTTSAQSPPKGVEDRALGAQPKSSLINLGSTPSSDPSGTTLIHGLPDLLASLAIPSKSSLTLPTKPIVPSPELTDTGVGGAHSSDIQSKNVLSIVGVRWNPHADQPSFSPQGNGGPPVQVLAKSGKPPGSFGGADHLETPSSSKLWSSCIPGGKTSSASQPGNSSSSWSKIFRRRKSNSVNPDPGQTNDTRPPVAHSSDKNPSESAATPALTPQLCPLGHEKGGSNPVAHSSDNQSESAATPALTPQLCPLGHEKGGTERNGAGSQFEELAFLMLMMKYTTSQPSLPPLLTHPCVPEVPNLLALQARVA
jgi:hypothetical protein